MNTTNIKEIKNGSGIYYSPSGETYQSATFWHDCDYKGMVKIRIQGVEHTVPGSFIYTPATWQKKLDLEFAEEHGWLIKAWNNRMEGLRPEQKPTKKEIAEVCKTAYSTFCRVIKRADNLGLIKKDQQKGYI